MKTGESIPGRENSMYKGPVVGTTVVLGMEIKGESGLKRC